MNRKIIIRSITLFFALAFAFSSNVTTIRQNSTEPFPNDTDCEKATDMIIQKILNNATLPPEYADVAKLLEYTGTGLNDLGDYYACKKLNFSQYLLVNIQVQAMMSMSIGLCYLKACNKTYVRNATEHLIKFINTSFGIQIPEGLIAIEDPDELLESARVKYFTSCIVTGSILGFLVILILARCGIKYFPKRKAPILYDALIEEKPVEVQIEKEHEQRGFSLRNIFDIFDMEKNANSLWSVQNPNKTFEHLRILDGVRFFSAGWVAFGHTVFFPFLIGIKNQSDLLFLSKTWRFCSLVAAFYAVDVFFFLSGFFLYFTFQKDLSHDIPFLQRVKKFIFSLIARYVRLFPFLILIIFGLTYLLPFLGNGPNFYKIAMINQSCEKHGWENLLYINNLVDMSITEGQCAGHTWYLACDMQFYVASTFVLIFFNRLAIVRHILFGLTFLFSLIWQIYEVFKYEYSYNDYLNMGPNGVNFFQDFYTHPFARVTPFIVGIYFCEFFVQTPLYKNDNKKSDKKEANAIASQKDTENQVSNEDTAKTEPIGVIERINLFLINNNLVCFILFLVSLGMINYGFFISSISYRQKISLFWSAMFNTFNKVIFVFGLGVILHLTFLGKLGFIKALLSFSLYTRIARATYGIYLLHVYFITLLFVVMNSFLYLKLGDFFLLAFGVVTISWICSFIIGLIIESPIVCLLKPLVREKK